MSKIKLKSLVTRLLLAGLMVGLSFVSVGAQAAGQLTSRSLTLGSSAASGVTTHKFAFTAATTASIGSVGFQYCTTASGTCTMPTGLSTTGGSLTDQTGVSNFVSTGTMTTNGAPYVTRTAASLIAGAAVTFTFSTITNPSATNTTFYVRITTYTGTDGATGATDAGVVAASTANQIIVSAQVPESLSFCVYTGANCAAGGGTVALGFLSATATTYGNSKMDASTNASSGYAITVNGTTLTSGANTIPAYTAAASPATGTSGFGINLRANSYTPAGGSAVSTGADVVNGSSPSIGTYGAGYGTANTFNFATGEQVATASGPSNNNTFTVSYIANMGGAQAAGTYSTTLTYICTATF